MLLTLADELTPLRAIVIGLAVIPVSLVAYLLVRPRPTSLKWIKERVSKGAPGVSKAELRTWHKEPLKFRLANGRTIAYSVFGPAGAFRTVLFLHGQPGSRLPPLLDLEEIANERDVRIIIPDRPGYGFSDYDRGMTPASYARELGELLAHLDRESAEWNDLDNDLDAGDSTDGLFSDFGSLPSLSSRFSATSLLSIEEGLEVVGFSLGAPHALAFATLFPNIRRLTLLAPTGFTYPPSDATEGIAPVQATVHRLIAAGYGFLLRIIWFIAATSMVHPLHSFSEQMVPSLSPADRAYFTENPARLSLWESHAAESFRAGIPGPLRDILICLGTTHVAGRETKWGFPVSRLSCPLRVIRGTEDSLVSKKMARYLYTVFSSDDGRSKLVEVDGLGHFGVLKPEYWLD